MLHPGDGTARRRLEIHGRVVEITRAGCGPDPEQARARIAAIDGAVDVIGLEGFPVHLQLGSEEVVHEVGRRLLQAARRTPVVDGTGVRPCLERWAVPRAEQAQPGVFKEKRALMVPGLNHGGLAHALARLTRQLRYADPAIFFKLPRLPGVGSPRSVEPVAPATLGLLGKAPAERLRPRLAEVLGRRARPLFQWAQVLAGDIHMIRQLPPDLLRGRTLVVEWAEEADLEDLRRRGARLVVTVMPSLGTGEPLGEHSAATVEALLAVLRPHPDLPLCEDTYLDIIAEFDWKPAVRYLEPQEADVNRFAFVIHPLDVGYIHRDRRFRWTRYLPDSLVEYFAALMPPMYISKVTGGVSARTQQRVEGHLIGLGATPRQMLRRKPEFTYKRLRRAARMAESLGARVMGLGAFTSVVGDAGLTVARDAPISVTSGNSLTVAATLEAAMVAARQMGVEDPSRARAMIIGATGSIGSVCARMIAQTIPDVVLVSIEPEKLIDLKRLIRQESGARVVAATRSAGLVGNCDVIITATSGFGQRILDISQCKPGAIICDVARPPDISPQEAALRPDVLVIESGEVVIPGDVEFGYDIGLPPRVSYACLAETALLAMDGRFESFTLGRQIRVDRVKEIQRLFEEHGFRLAGLRSLGRYLTEEDLADKRRLADELRSDGVRFTEVRDSASRRLAEIPMMSKGVAGRSRAAGAAGARWFGGIRARG